MAGIDKYMSMPTQKISNRDKTDEWAKQTIDQIRAYSNTSKTQYNKDLINYDLFNGIINIEDFVHITNPYSYNEDKEMPVDFNHYDIVTSKLKLLIGEEIKRPFNYVVRAVNADSISEKEERKKNQMLEQFKQIITAELATENLIKEEELKNIEQGQVMSLEEIDKYYTYNYKEIKEVIAQDILNYVVKHQQLQFTFNKGFKDALITGKEIYHITDENNEVVVRLINPLNFDYDKSNDADFIHDSQWCVYSEYLTPGEVLARFGRDLSDSEVEYLDTVNRSAKSIGTSDDIVVFKPDGPIGVSSDSYYDEQGIRVDHVEWKSMRKIGFLKYIDDNGELQEVLVDENYKKNDKQVSLEWVWIPEVWEGYVIDDEIYTRVRPKPNQYRSIDNPFNCTLSYTGMIYDNRNSDVISLLDRMKPFQYEFNITMYQIGLEKNKSKGKKMIYDLAQLPRGGEGDWTMEQWLYYADVLGIIFINSLQQDEKGNRSSYNQMKDIDMSISSSINQLFEYLREIDYRCARVSGVTDQREGQIGPTELATNSERAVLQSSHITEELFYKHNEVKKAVLTKCLEVAKTAYKNGKKLQYITDDLGIKLINVNPEVFNNADYGLFISNSAKDEQSIQYAKSMAEAALQSGTISLSDVITITTTESLTDIKNKLKLAEQRKAQQEQQLQEQQMQMQQQLEQAKLEQERLKMELEQSKIQAELEKNIRDNQTKILIEQMKIEAEGGDSSKYEKVVLDYEVALKKLQQEKELKIKELDQTKMLKEKELAIKREVEMKKAANKPAPTKK